jgi:hypothetical protein
MRKPASKRASKPSTTAPAMVSHDPPPPPPLLACAARGDEVLAGVGSVAAVAELGAGPITGNMLELSPAGTVEEEMGLAGAGATPGS